MVRGKSAVTCAVAMLSVLTVGLCGPARAGAAEQRQTESAGASVREIVGLAGWRGEAFDGRSTATGERYDMYRLTAASADLPLGSYAEVTNLATGEAVVVRINDRAPAEGAAVITLSYAAAHRLGVDGPGLAPVRVSWTGGLPRLSRSAAAAGDARPRPALARIGDGLQEDVFLTARREGLRGLFRDRQRRVLMATWAESAPTPIAGL